LQDNHNIEAENLIRFYVAVMEFKAASKNVAKRIMDQHARKLFATYIASDAPRPIKIDEATRKTGANALRRAARVVVHWLCLIRLL
jgi:hypothetical protein